MSLTEEQHIHLDSERTTHPSMEGHSRSSRKYLLLQVWCGLLTVVVVVGMAAFFTSMKPRSTEDRVSTTKPDNVITTSPTIYPLLAPLKSAGSSLSYIQLIKSLDGRSWQESPECRSCSLSLHNDSIHCSKSSLYLIYAQVTFTKHPDKNHTTKSVILRRNATSRKAVRKLVGATLAGTKEGSVWVARIVSLMAGDSISLETTHDFLKDGTFWGAFQLI